MPGLSKVIVLDPDARAGRQIQLGFQREGVPAELLEVPTGDGAPALPHDDLGLVVVGGADDPALELVRQTRRALDEASVDAPIVFAGRGVRRTDAEAAGADEVVLAPAYLRDIVTIGRLLRGQPASHRAHLVGNLAETTGVLTLVRALSALGRSAMLTLIRGLRRGEIRFYHGEVTSAHVGGIHGQAALHQLLLWTDARFDFYHEDIVRRHQIPLERDELFADAERFLAGVRDSSGKLSPAMVLEQDALRLQSLGAQIPLEVHGVLRMFDGHRVLSDVLEDSPYRVFETLRVTQLAVEAGLLRTTAAPRPRATWRAVLALEEWLVGAEPRARAFDRAADVDTEPVPDPAPDGPSDRTAGGAGGGGGGGASGKSKGSRKKRKKRKAPTPVAVAAPAPPTASVAPAASAASVASVAPRDIDWGQLVPRVVGVEVGPLAGVVPAWHASGEIELPARGQREKLESLTDTQRGRLFPTERRSEPSIVWDEAADRARAEVEQAERAERAAAEQAAATVADAARDAEAAAAEDRVEREVEEAVTARTERRAAVFPVVDSSSGPVSAMDLVKQLSLDPDPGAHAHGAPTEPMAAVTPTESEPVTTEPAPAAEPTPAAAAAEPAPTAEPAPEPAPPAAAAEPAPETEPAPATEPASEPAPPAATAEPEPDITAPVAVAPEPAAEPSPPAAAAEPEPDITAPVAVAPEPAVEPAPEPPPAATAAEPVPEPEPPPAATAAEPVPETTAAESEPPVAPEQLAAPEPPTPDEEPARDTAPIVSSELAPTASGELSAPEELPLSERPTAPMSAVRPNRRVAAELPAVIVDDSPDDDDHSAAPDETLDEPSDGIIRQPIASAETAPSGRRPPPPTIPPDDRPEDTTGEIVAITAQQPAVVPPDLAEPSILVADLATEPAAVAAASPGASSPDLVADLAAAHAAVSAVAATPPAAPTPSFESPAQAEIVATVRDDATAFTDAEEDFFRAGHEKPVRPPSHNDSFDDLDEGYQPVGFWDRLLGRRPKR